MCDFKSGELVKIRQWSDMVSEFGLNDRGSIECFCYFLPAMKFLCGKYAIITKIFNDGRVDLRFFNCKRRFFSYSFHIDMLEKLE